MVLTGGCGEGILGGLGGGKGEGGYDQNTVLACAKFSKSTLKYILRCKLRRPENGKRGGNKSPRLPQPRKYHSGSHCPLLSFKSLGGYCKERTASKVFLRSARQKQLSSAVIYEYFLACGWYFSFFFYTLMISNFLYGKKRQILLILRKQSKSK